MRVRWLWRAATALVPVVVICQWQDLVSSCAVNAAGLVGTRALLADSTAVRALAEGGGATESVDSPLRSSGGVVARLLRHAPGDPRGREFLGKIRLAIGDVTGAVRELAMLPVDWRTTEVGLFLGDALWRAGDRTGALEWYSKARYMRRLARVREAARDLSDDAWMGALQAIISSNSEDPVAEYEMGEVLFRTGDAGGALKHYTAYMRNALAVRVHTNDERWQGYWHDITIREPSRLWLFHRILAGSNLEGVSMTTVRDAWMTWTRYVGWESHVLVDTGIYGYVPGSYGGDRDGAVIFADGSRESEGGHITYRAYDIDYPGEVEVYVGLRKIGPLPKTADNGWSGWRRLAVPVDADPGAGPEVLVFDNTANPPLAYQWAVELRLSGTVGASAESLGVSGR